MSSSRVMIVEDEGLIADDIANELSLSGYEIAAICRSGEDALISIGSTQPHLILLDIKLSGEMDGIEAAHRIRAEHDIPVVFLTSHADSETQARAMQAKHFGYLLKPFRRATLCNTVDRAILKHRSEAVS